MKTVMHLPKLVEILKTNREKHRAVFLAAQENFRAAVIAALESRLEDVRDGKKIDQYIRLTEPMDQTKDYDRVLAMCAHSSDDHITLDENDFKSYVLDQWGWKDQWKMSNATYTHVDDDA